MTRQSPRHRRCRYRIRIRRPRIRPACALARAAQTADTNVPDDGEERSGSPAPKAAAAKAPAAAQAPKVVPGAAPTKGTSRGGRYPSRGGPRNVYRGPAASDPEPGFDGERVGKSDVNGQADPGFQLVCAGDTCWRLRLPRVTPWLSPDHETGPPSPTRSFSTPAHPPAPAKKEHQGRDRHTKGPREDRTHTGPRARAPGAAGARAPKGQGQGRGPRTGAAPGGAPADQKKAGAAPAEQWGNEEGKAELSGECFIFYCYWRGNRF